MSKLRSTDEERRCLVDGAGGNAPGGAVEDMVRVEAVAVDRGLLCMAASRSSCNRWRGASWSCFPNCCSGFNLYSLSSTMLF